MKSSLCELRRAESNGDTRGSPEIYRRKYIFCLPILACLETYPTHPG